MDIHSVECYIPIFKERAIYCIEGDVTEEKEDQITFHCMLNLSNRQRPSPAALVVEEEDEVEFLFGLVLHLLSNAKHVRGGHGDGHPIVLATHSWHVGVDDLHTHKGAGGGERAIKTLVVLSANTLLCTDSLEHVVKDVYTHI